MRDKKISAEKSDSKNLIDYSLFKDDPEKLFILSQNCFNNSDFEQGLNILKNSIDLASKKFGGPNQIELAQFYNKYSDGLIQKIISSNADEAFENKDFIIEENEENDFTCEFADILNERIIEDEDIAFANLNAGNIILKKYLEKYDNKDPKTLDEKIIDYYIQLSDNYSLFASLEKLNSDFKKADYYYQLSIDIYKKYDKYSRNLAGLYFEHAQIMDFDPKNCLLSLYKSKIIMEYHLQKELEKNNISIIFDIDENELDIDYLPYDSKIIFKNKKLIENKEILKACEGSKIIGDFVDLINDIDDKIENVIMELKEYDNYIKGKKTHKSKDNKEISFNNDDKGNTITEKKSISIITKKRIEPFNDEDDIKIPKDIYTKEKIYK